ncbi:hypothetical protein TUM17563_09210 [Klebsiella oxytoca]|nr:hypothetical protein TUM17563_09210 [Klebsiella oxytoca]
MNNEKEKCHAVSIHFTKPQRKIIKYIHEKNKTSFRKTLNNLINQNGLIAVARKITAQFLRFFDPPRIYRN